MFRWNIDRSGAHRDYHPRHAPGYRRLDLFGRRRGPVLKISEDFDEELAFRTEDLFANARLIYGLISEECTEEHCPVTCAGPRYEYRWIAGRPIAAPRYFELLFEWVQSQLDDEGLFPTQLGQPRSCSSREFHERLQTIFKRLLRVYAHIYYEHFERISQLGAAQHLNTSFKEFIVFALMHDLIPERAQLQPLKCLILRVCSDTWHQQLRRHVTRRWSRVRRVAPNVGGFSALLLELYNEVHYRPGNQGAESARVHFATTVANADLLSGKTMQAMCYECDFAE